VELSLICRTQSRPRGSRTAICLTFRFLPDKIKLSRGSDFDHMAKKTLLDTDRNLRAKTVGYTSLGPPETETKTAVNDDWSKRSGH